MNEGFLKLNNKDVMIDEELIPLIKELNNVGLHTTSCCQGHGKNPAYITIKLDTIYQCSTTRHIDGHRLIIKWNWKDGVKNE